MVEKGDSTKKWLVLMVVLLVLVLIVELVSLSVLYNIQKSNEEQDLSELKTIAAELASSSGGGGGGSGFWNCILHCLYAGYSGPGSIRACFAGCY